MIARVSPSPREMARSSAADCQLFFSATVWVEQLDDHDSAGFAFAEGNGEVVRGRLPALLQRDFVFCSNRGNKDLCSQRRSVLQAFHDLARREVPDEIFCRAAPNLEGVFYDVR